MDLSKIEDFGEAARFESRFAKIPTGYAFRANDGDIRPLSEQEMEAALVEGVAAIRHGAAVLKYSGWAILALAVAGVTMQNGGGSGIFSSKAIVAGWLPALHMLGWVYFQWHARRVPRAWSARVQNRIRLSPALVGPMLRRNWFKPLRAALAIGTVAYMLWITFTITGSFAPESLGAGAVIIDGHTGSRRVIAGDDPDAQMGLFMTHMPEILLLIAACYIVYFAEWIVDRSIKRDVMRIR